VKVKTHKVQQFNLGHLYEETSLCKNEKEQVNYLLYKQVKIHILCTHYMQNCKGNTYKNNSST